MVSFYHLLSDIFIYRSIVTSSSTTSVPSHAWEETTGLLSSLIPQAKGNDAKRTTADVASFNTSKGELKLGPAPMDEGLQTETERILRENGTELSDQDLQLLRPPTSGNLLAPQSTDLPPLPPSFQTLDVKREVERIRDARKKIRLEPSALTLEKDSSSPQAAAARARALPSICAYTMYDVGDGYVS